MRSLLVFMLACGSSPPASVAAGPPAPMEPRAAADDVIVATVNGKPVWGACVAAQAARGADRKQALQQCVDFELLAQTAEARGFAVLPEVASATHTAMVSELVASEYEDKFNTPEQFGAFWAKAYQKGVFRVRHENYRASTYVRVPVASATDPGEAEHALATKIADATAHETGLLGPSLLAIAQQAVGPDVKLQHEDVTAYKIGALDDHYGNSLFALKEIGRASEPVRTKWGWDIIVWTDDVPAVDPPEAEVIEELLPDIKLAYFKHWVDGIAHKLGVTVALDQANIAKLEDL